MSTHPTPPPVWRPSQTRFSRLLMRGFSALDVWLGVVTCAYDFAERHLRQGQAHLRRHAQVALARRPVAPVHGKRAHIHAPATLGERVADVVTGEMGSWRFIGIQTAIVTLWIICNVIGWRLHWDVYPFILLNLVFSTQAAYASPLILMAGNRAAARDRARDDLEAHEVDELWQLNQQQLTILKQQSEILELLRSLQDPAPSTAATALPDTPTQPVERKSRAHPQSAT